MAHSTSHWDDDSGDTFPNPTTVLSHKHNVLSRIYTSSIDSAQKSDIRLKHHPNPAAFLFYHARDTNHTVVMTRSRKVRDSLGESWGDADDSSDGGASIHSMSSVAGYGSDSEYVQDEDDMATPLPPRATRASSLTPHDGLVTAKKPTTTTTKTTSRPPRNYTLSQTATSSRSALPSAEPSLIMPSMDDSISSFNEGSPVRKSQLRARKAKQTRPRNQAEDVPQTKKNGTHRKEEDPKIPTYIHFVWQNFLDLTGTEIVSPNRSLGPLPVNWDIPIVSAKSV